MRSSEATYIPGRSSGDKDRRLRRIDFSVKPVADRTVQTCHLSRHEKKLSLHAAAEPLGLGRRESVQKAVAGCTDLALSLPMYESKESVTAWFRSLRGSVFGEGNAHSGECGSGESVFLLE